MATPKRKFTPNQFTLTVELGNAAMQDSYDVSRLLHELASTIERNDFARVDGGKVRDLNGNTVGIWEVK